MTANRVEDRSPVQSRQTGLIGHHTDPIEESLRVQQAIEATFGVPEQLLGGKAGSMTLRYRWTDQDAVETLRRSGALILSSGKTPIRLGGPAVVPMVVAMHGTMTVLAKGRVDQGRLLGLDVIIAEPGSDGSANPEIRFRLLREILEHMPDPDEALIGFLFQSLDHRFASSSEAGNRLLGRVLSALGEYLRQRS